MTIAAAFVAFVAFVAMEGVSYLLHRFVMHGPGRSVHADHHRPPAPGFERNDLYPASLALFTIALFVVGTWVGGFSVLVPAAVGMTAYGCAYLYVHELCIHRRLSVRRRGGAYVAWLERMHRIHHLYGGEPYGMLLPIVPSALRERAAADAREPLARVPIRSMRSRL